MISGEKVDTYKATQEAGSKVVDISYVRELLAGQLAARQSEGGVVLTAMKNWFFKVAVVAAGAEDDYKEGCLAGVDKHETASGIRIDTGDDIINYHKGDSVYFPLRDAVFTSEGVLTMKVNVERKNEIEKINEGNRIVPMLLDDIAELANYESMFVSVEEPIQSGDIAQIGKPLKQLKEKSILCKVGAGLDRMVAVKLYHADETKNLILPSSSAVGISGIVSEGDREQGDYAIAVEETFFENEMSEARIPDSSDPATAKFAGFVYVDGILMKGVDLSQIGAKLMIPYVFGDGSEYTVTIETEGDDEGLNVTSVTSTLPEGKSGIISVPLTGNLKSVSDPAGIIFNVTETTLGTVREEIPVIGMQPIRITKVYYAGKVLENNVTLTDSKIRIWYENGYGRSVGLSGTVSGDEIGSMQLQTLSGVSLNGASGYVDLPLIGATGDCGAISFDIDITYSEPELIIYPEDNQELTCPAEVKDLRLAQWNFSTPSAYVQGGTAVIDYEGVIRFPYYTNTLGLDNEKQDATNLNGRENGYCAVDIPAQINLENCNNQIHTGNQYYVSLNRMTVHPVKLESRIVFTVPVRNFKAGSISLTLDLWLTNATPKQWMFAYRNTDGTEVPVTWKEGNAGLKYPNISNKHTMEFPISDDIESGEITLVLKPLIAGREEPNNMLGLANTVVVKYVPTNIE